MFPPPRNWSTPSPRRARQSGTLEAYVSSRVRHEAANRVPGARNKSCAGQRMLSRSTETHDLSWCARSRRRLAGGGQIGSRGDPRRTVLSWTVRAFLDDFSRSPGVRIGRRGCDSGVASGLASGCSRGAPPSSRINQGLGTAGAPVPPLAGVLAQWAAGRTPASPGIPSWTTENQRRDRTSAPCSRRRGPSTGGSRAGNS